METGANLLATSTCGSRPKPSTASTGGSKPPTRTRPPVGRSFPSWKTILYFSQFKRHSQPNQKKHPKQNEAKNTRQYALTHRLEFFLLSKNKQICLKPKKQFINYIYENFFFFSKTSNFEWKFVTDLSVGLKKVRNIGEKYKLVHIFHLPI